VRLLLDTHIAKGTVAALQRYCPGVDAAQIADWRGGRFRTADDAAILTACSEDGRVLVTYDQRTIPGLLRLWAAEERPHAGVIFCDENSLPARSAGAVAKALARLVHEMAGAEMTNVVRYARSAGPQGD
jgi:uncharacterized protein DUF5615